MTTSDQSSSFEQNQADAGANSAALLDEATLVQLVNDTSAEVVIELIDFYIDDAKQRLQTILNAIQLKDIQTLEFEAHSLGSTAAAHGNLWLCQICRQIETDCLENDHEQAWQHAKNIEQVALSSFQALSARKAQGFSS